MNYSEEDKHPHRVNTKYSQKVYWTRSEEEGYICAGDELNCTQVELRPLYAGYPTFTFEMPHQRYELEKMERFLAECYERGKIDRSVEIGKMMKELIAL